MTTVDFQTTSTYRMSLAIAWLIIITVGVYIIFLLRIKRRNDKEKSDYRIITESLTTFASIIDAKDPNTKGHSLRVATYSKEIAKRMKMSQSEQDRIFRIALLHDIGKVGVRDDVLKKTGRLTDEELSVIRDHAEIGGQILEHITSIEGLSEGAYYHHERIDGTGYPRGHKGDEIPFVARIICVADSYDAMSSDRCYRKSLSEEYIRGELESCKDKLFDSEIVPYMIEMMDDGFAPIKNVELISIEKEKIITDIF